MDWNGLKYKLEWGSDSFGSNMNRAGLRCIDIFISIGFRLIQFEIIVMSCLETIKNFCLDRVQINFGLIQFKSQVIVQVKKISMFVYLGFGLIRFEDG